MDSWWVLLADGVRMASGEELEAMLTNRSVGASTPVCSVGDASWSDLRDVRRFAALLHEIPSTPDSAPFGGPESSPPSGPRCPISEVPPRAPAQLPALKRPPSVPPPTAPRRAAAPSILRPGSSADSKDPRAPPLAVTPRVSGRALPAGVLLENRFRIVEHISRGGFGDVYIAEDLTLESRVALKIPHPYADDAVLSKLVRRTCCAWDSLCDRAPGLVVRLKAVLPAVLPGGRSCLVMAMELVSAGSLAQVVHRRSGGYPRSHEQITWTLGLFLQACRAVRAVHAAGLLHRDIKPGNFLVTAEPPESCKLADFESLAPIGSPMDPGVGTRAYLAPECLLGDYTPASEVYSLAATLFQLLTGILPFGEQPDEGKRRPPSLVAANPIVSDDLALLVTRCLDPAPANRPPTVGDLLDDLARMGVGDDSSTTAPVGLARMLEAHLPEQDLAYLTASLERRGFRTSRLEPAQRRRDLLQEYCYTASPRDILAENCTARQLSDIATALDVHAEGASAREDQVRRVAAALGFVPDAPPLSGIETSRRLLNRQLVELSHATTVDEVLGSLQSCLSSVERVVELLNAFFGQLLYGSGVDAFLSRAAGGKPAHLLTFGQKVGALRELCLRAPAYPLPHRIAQVFAWPILDKPTLELLDGLVTPRNALAHGRLGGSIASAQATARETISRCCDLATAIANSPHAPNLVQIVARHDDVHGRKSFLARDERGHLERIFTPLPLRVGSAYLFFPLTNPVRINPLLFPAER